MEYMIGTLTISDNFWKQWDKICMLDDIWEQIKLEDKKDELVKRVEKL